MAKARAQVNKYGRVKRTGQERMSFRLVEFDHAGKPVIVHVFPDKVGRNKFISDNPLADLRVEKGMRDLATRLNLPCIDWTGEPKYDKEAGREKR